MSFSHWNWKYEPNINTNLVEYLTKKLPYHPFFIQLCIRRGLDTVEKIQEFVDPSPTLFHDPHLMFDMKKAVDRITRAIEQDELILIYGDYDADGITSTTILKEALEMQGANVVYYLPDRFVDGYGPNRSVFEYYIEQGVGLIITVDCGIAAIEPIVYAMNQNVDVIVTDHHEIPEELPPAYAVVHPRHPKGEYPFKDLSGAGVAFKLATALLGEAPIEMLDVAAIGTIADLVSLTDENRTIVKQGLKVLQQTQRVGLLSLYDQLGIDIKTINETTIGFLIGPRFNALGRLGDASPGVELLTTFDEEEAEEIVEYMIQQNTKRQEIVNQIVQEAKEQLEEQKEELVHVLYHSNWHEGVLGIVASKIVEQTGKPTILLTQAEDGLAKGSARSVEAFNIFDALQQAAPLLVKYGGHHMAGGLSLEKENIDALFVKMNQLATEYKEEIQAGKVVHISDVLALSDISVEFVEQLNLLRPFGTDNVEPLVEIRDVTLQKMRTIGANQEHLKADFSDGKQVLQTIAFKKGEWATNLPIDAQVSIIGRLSINEWKNLKSPQLQVEDMRSVGRLFFDRRSSKLKTEQLTILNAIYLVDHQNLVEKVRTQIPEDSIVMLWSEVQEDTFVQTDKQNLVIVDCPSDRCLVERVLSYPNSLSTYVIAVSLNNATTIGMPTRKQFAKVYQFLKQAPTQSLQDIPVISKKLQLQESLLKFILNVFFEVKFVTIDKGLFVFNQNPDTVNLEETTLMKKRIDQLWLEKQFIYSEFVDVKKWLMNEHKGEIK